MTTAAPQQVFHLPDLGEGLTDAEIIEWKVAVGDTVEIDQIVVDVETAKAAVEVPVPYAGTVLRLYGEAGSSVTVGAPLIEVGATDTVASGPPSPDGPADSGGAPNPTGASDPGASDEDPSAARYREEEAGGSGNVLIGYGTGHTVQRRRRRRAAGASRPAEQAGSPGPVGGAPSPEISQPAAKDLAPRVISPLVRRLAREHGVDLAALAATGPHGVARRRDVEAAVAEAARPARALPVATPDEERIPLRGMRKAVAEKLSLSRREIPDATTWVDVDATELLAAKNVIQGARPELGIGLLALLARICVAGLRRFPELNSTVDTGAQEIVRYAHINLGIAAQTERGLVVPVVRDAHLMSTAQIAAELTRLTSLARAGTLPPHALTGGTFTLNNYGVFGVDGSTPIINHPEAGILGVGRIIDRPWAVDGAIALRKITQLSLSFDHRVCDGGTAGGFLRYVADCVENPAVLLTDL